MLRLPQIRNGIYVFSYRPIEHWERKLLIDNAHYNTNHILATNTTLIRVLQRIGDTIRVNREFEPIAVKDWYTYEYRTELNQMYPRTMKWINVEIPNKPVFTTYIPNIINNGDTLVFEADRPKDLN